MSAPDIATPQQRSQFMKILAAIAPGQTVTADLIHDDAHKAAQLPPASLGGLFRGSVEAGYLFPIGYTTAVTPSRKGGVIRVYERTSTPIPAEHLQAAS